MDWRPDVLSPLSQTFCFGVTIVIIEWDRLLRSGLFEEEVKEWEECEEEEDLTYLDFTFALSIWFLGQVLLDRG